ncbi:hypothetical protein KAW48_01690 [candidate division WOR-3 bacterium]|nr:hypothetical protein [candidate division WOR-3 bacterium]
MGKVVDYTAVNEKFMSRKEKWSKFVDIATVIWLGIFIIGFFSTGKIAHACDILNIVLLSVFVADLVIIYRSSGSWHVFLKKHWFDILMVIPYFRVFRIFRIFRVLKIVRMGKAARALKATKMATKYSKVLRLGKSNKLIKVGHETYDLIRTVKGRMFRKR